MRCQIYWHLAILARELRPISDKARVRPPRKVGDVDKVEEAVEPLLTDIVGLFGSEKNIVCFVDDDAETTAQQIKQVVDLQQNLSTAIADYLDVVEGIDGGGTRRTKVRKDFVTAFRQLQDKLDLVLEELHEWGAGG